MINPFSRIELLENEIKSHLEDSNDTRVCNVCAPLRLELSTLMACRDFVENFLLDMRNKLFAIDKCNEDHGQGGLIARSQVTTIFREIEKELSLTSSKEAKA